MEVRSSSRERARDRLPTGWPSPLEVRVGEEALDRNRLERLRGMEHEERHVPGEERHERRRGWSLRSGARSGDERE